MKAPRHLGWRKNRIRENNGVFEPPDREWLKHQYLTLGKMQHQIAQEVRCNKRTVAAWCEMLDVHKTKEQIDKQHCKYRRPSRNELIDLFLTQNKSVEEIAQEIGGCVPQLVYNWPRAEDIKKPAELRYARLMDGNSTNWRGGISRQYQKIMLLRLGRPLKCEWCGSEGDEQHIHLHHIDHNRKNGYPSNLLMLCYHCNLLEAQLNRLQEKGLATFTVEPGERIEVRFLKKLGESLEDSA